MGSRKRRLVEVFDNLQDLPDTPLPIFDPRSMQEQIEASMRKERNPNATSMTHHVVPRSSPATRRPNDSTRRGHNSPTPDQTEPADYLLPIEVGEDYSTFAAQQPDDDREGFVFAESLAGDIPGVSPAVSIAPSETRRGPDVVHFPYDDCESVMSWTSGSGESRTFSDSPLLAESIYPEPVIPDDDTEDIESEVFKMTEFLASRIIVEAFKQIKSVEELRGLPVYRDTLRRQFLSSLPFLSMRRKTLTLDKKMIESRKTDKEDFLMFDLEDIVTTYLSSERNQKNMVRGLAHRTDGVVDHARQAQWWGESIRTTSGQCVRMDDDTVLFPSDFVTYRNEDDDCQDASNLRWGRTHLLGRPGLYGYGYPDGLSRRVPQGLVRLSFQRSQRCRGPLARCQLLTWKMTSLGWAHKLFNGFPSSALAALKPHNQGGRGAVVQLARCRLLEWKMTSVGRAPASLGRPQAFHQKCSSVPNLVNMSKLVQLRRAHLKVGPTSL
ncbi:hypothetical protein E4U38_006398 [Claviceps purpurea]|nr:hypothetical protein E4U38_006398 [Claviceps purpurea]